MTTNLERLQNDVEELKLELQRVHDRRAKLDPATVPPGKVAVVAAEAAAMDLAGQELEKRLAAAELVAGAAERERAQATDRARMAELEKQGAAAGEAYLSAVRSLLAVAMKIGEINAEGNTIRSKWSDATNREYPFGQPGRAVASAYAFPIYPVWVSWPDGLRRFEDQLVADAKITGHAVAKP